MPADVTVVIPTHNRLHLLPGAISSVLGQQDVSVQVVVVNDGSTDGTKPWLDRLAAQDCRIKVVHHDRPLRMSSARNAGIAHATARWVAFCDDDDLWAPDKLAAQLSALTAESARWGCTGGVLVDEDLRILGHHRVRGGNVLPDLTSRNVIPSGGSSVIAEARLLRDVGGFRPCPSRIRRLGSLDSIGSAFTGCGGRSADDCLSTGTSHSLDERRYYAERARNHLRSVRRPSQRTRSQGRRSDARALSRETIVARRTRSEGRLNFSISRRQASAVARIAARGGGPSRP